MSKKYQYLFLIFVFILLIFPITKINNEDKSDEENRQLAKKWELFNENGFNINFSKEFDAWINDRFRGRAEILRAYNTCNYFIMRKVDNNMAFKGEDNWLFYKGEESIINFQNRKLYSDEQLTKIRDIINMRKKYLKKYGIDYYIMIVPDKNRVYGEYYPKCIHKLSDYSRGEQLVAYLKENNIDVIYPLKELTSAKETGIIYYKYDTHWNTYGAFIGYEEMMYFLSMNYNNIDKLERNDFYVDNIPEYQTDYLDKKGIVNNEKIIGNKGDGDLHRMLYSLTYDENIPSEPILNMEKKKEYNFKIVEYKDNLGVGGIHTTNQKARNRMKLLMLRDSFSMAMMPYIAESFSDVEFIWSHDFNLYFDDIIRLHPDLVIQEIGERGINCLLQEPNFKEER